MRLVYKHNGEPIHVGDRAKMSNGEWVEVTYFREPHKSSSSGKVAVQPVGDSGMGMEYYVGVIGAEWIEREDQ